MGESSKWGGVEIQHAVSPSAGGKAGKPRLFEDEGNPRRYCWASSDIRRSLTSWATSWKTGGPLLSIESWLFKNRILTIVYEIIPIYLDNIIPHIPYTTKVFFIARLRLVVYPIIYKVFWPSRWLFGIFEPSTIGWNQRLAFRQNWSRCPGPKVEHF